MSDLAAANCGNPCPGGCGCHGDSGCGNLWLILILLCCCGGGWGGNDCGNNNGCDNIIWILLLLCCCGNGLGSICGNNGGFGGCC